MKSVAQDAMRPSHGWEVWFAKLDDCRTLEDGWNGYSAAAPMPAAIEHAELFLKAMQKAGYEPTRVSASAMGGVAITRRNDSKKVLVEFYNDGRAFALFSGYSADMDVKQIPTDAVAFAACVSEMQSYLNA